MVKIDPPTRNFLRTFVDVDVNEYEIISANTRAQEELDLIASYGGIVNFVKPTHLEQSTTMFIDIGFKIPKIYVDNFLKEEKEL